jgi:hypothetical protein
MNLYLLHNNPKTLKNYDEDFNHMFYMIQFKNLSRTVSLNEWDNLDKDKLKKFILSSPQFAYKLADCFNTCGKNTLKVYKDIIETSVSKSGEYSYKYAFNILNDRFYIGEEAMINDKNVNACLNYAIDVLNGQFEKAEPMISEYFYQQYLDNQDNVENETVLLFNHYMLPYNQDSYLYSLYIKLTGSDPLYELLCK